MVGDSIAELFSAAALGQSLLALGLIWADRKHRLIHIPLALFFAANACTELSSMAGSAAFSGLPEMATRVLDRLGIPALLVLPPAFWLYVRGVTSEGPPAVSRSDSLHAVVPLLGCVAFAFGMALDDQAWSRLFGDGNAQPETLFELVYFLFVAVLFFAWIGQLTAYIAAILRRLVRYRARLHDLFASTENRELRWIWWLALAMGGYWLLTVFSIMGEGVEGYEVVPEAFEDAFDFVLIWVLAQWGLRQKPGLSPNHDVTAAQPQAPVGKYEKSGLSDEQMVSIAEKIRRVMAEDRLYLEPTMSLGDLSHRIGVVPNYVSQTLNAKIGETFFDYVNGWRIRDAMDRITLSNATILTIAYDVGFNSRSSFYKAFKAETGMTPTAYRETMAAGHEQKSVLSPAR